MRKSELAPCCRRLVELMQEVNFGTIERLQVRNGEPVLDPPPEIERVYKIGSTSVPPRLGSRADFVLKHEMVEFFAHLDALGTCSVRRIEVRHGLPRVVAVRNLKED